MVFIVFSRDSWGLQLTTDKYPLYRAYIGISHRGTLVGTVLFAGDDEKNTFGGLDNISGLRHAFQPWFTVAKSSPFY